MSCPVYNSYRYLADSSELVAIKNPSEALLLQIDPLS